MSKVVVDELTARLRAGQRTDFDMPWLQRYLGTPRPVLGWKNDNLRALARETIKAHKELAPEAWLEVIGALYAGETYEQRLLASFLLHANKAVHRSLPLARLRDWIAGLAGWAEIDNACQSGWTGAQMLERWDEWQPILSSAAGDPNISVRRASLVLLNKPVRTSDDGRLREQAFRNLDHLQGEREVIITKAVSWLLRELIKNHRAAVERYLDANSETLPKIALRETRKKLATGTKTTRASTT